jgi:general secretion pathway protein K
MTARGQERGAALLTVLMLVAVIAILATAALERLKLGTHIASNGAAMAQARAYAMAGERIAISRVAQLTSDFADRTFLAGGRTIPFPIDGGTASARISDGGNCFNLNSVVQGQPQTGLTARPVAAAQFAALIDVLGIAPQRARIIAASLTDWIDSDTFPQPGGAEDAAYLALPTPHRAANTLMADVRELREVSGMTPEIYAQLRPFICALPNSDLSPITVNTVTADQAPLVAMLLPGRITRANAKAIIASRPIGGFADVNAFWALPALAGSTPSPDVLAQVKLRPRWFVLQMRLTLGGVEFEENALIDGARQPARLVTRTYGERS